MNGYFRELVENFHEVTLTKPDDFLKIKETLTRIGIPSYSEKALFQTAHILHKQGRYFIVHFKQMFLLDGKPANFGTEDKVRLMRIIKLLEEWGMIALVNPLKNTGIIDTGNVPLKIVPFKEKSKWQLIPKYTIGYKGTDSLDKLKLSANVTN